MVSSSFVAMVQLSALLWRMESIDDPPYSVKLMHVLSKEITSQLPSPKYTCSRRLHLVEESVDPSITVMLITEQ